MMFYRPLAIAIVRDCLRSTESAANEGGLFLFQVHRIMAACIRYMLAILIIKFG